MPHSTNPHTPEQRTEHNLGRQLPLSPLLALSGAAFLTLLTEGLPAGVLPEMARGLSTTEAAVGQAVTVYAIATGLSAIPLARATAAWPRRRLLVIAIATFCVVTVVTAVSSSYPLTLGLRVIAGLAAAVVWSELVPYARLLAPSGLQGRAIAIALAGIPLALSLGMPLGSLLGRLVGWRETFALVACIGVVLAVWLRASVPEVPGRPSTERQPIMHALRLPGVVAILSVVVAYVLAHNILYTYLAAYLAADGLSSARESVLLVFGIASIVSVAVTAVLIDRRLRALTLTATTLFLAGIGILAALPASLAVVSIAAVLWGLGWGGVATLLQTAITDAGGARGQALFVATCNSSIADGAAVGGVLLATLGPRSFPWALMLLLIPVLLTVSTGRKHAFPPAGARDGV